MAFVPDPRALRAIALGVVMVATTSCRSAERTAREHLEGEGLEQIALTEIPGVGGTFSYTATNGSDRCVGRLAVSTQPGAPRIDDRVSCRPNIDLCAAGDPVTCFRLGRMHASGDDGALDPTDVDHQTAVGYFDASCQGRHAPACNALGLAYADGRGVAQDLGRAQQSFERACQLGSAKGCFNAALGHHYGRGVAVEPSRAVALYERACAASVAAACYNLGVCRRDGVGTDRSPLPATSAFAAACAGGHTLGCVNLGVMYATGDGVPVDVVAARSLFEKACRGGVEEGCRGLQQLDRAPE